MGYDKECEVVSGFVDDEETIKAWNEWYESTFGSKEKHKKRREYKAKYKKERKLECYA